MKNEKHYQSNDTASKENTEPEVTEEDLDNAIKEISGAKFEQQHENIEPAFEEWRDKIMADWASPSMQTWLRKMLNHAHSLGKKKGREEGIAYADASHPLTAKELTIDDAYRRGKKEGAAGEREQLLAMFPTGKIPTGINAIPATTDFANGWNDCRKLAFESLNSTLQAIKTAITK